MAVFEIAEIVQNYPKLVLNLGNKATELTPPSPAERQHFYPVGGFKQ
jgi:hypothetical protein